MKISNNTLDILKNFSEINQSILMKAGKKLKTVSTLKNILAHAEVEEDFPQDFAIYNLNEFIGLLSILNEPDLTFDDKYLTVSINDDKVKYFYADPTFIVKPEKELTMPEVEINFDLTKDTYLYLNKMATILQLHDIQLKGCPKSNKVYLCLTNKKDNTSNDYSRVVGNSTSKSFNIFFKRENLKIIPGDYTVSISSKGISHFKNNKENLEYWIALEPDSKYGE